MSKLATFGFAMLLAGAAVAQAPAHEYKIVNGELVLPTPIVFVPGSDKLKPESDAALDFVRDYLADKSYVSLVRVESHSDSAGSDALTQQRSRAIVLALIGKGVDCARLLPVGFGDSKPAFPSDTPESKARNQRIVVVNAALRGRAIGGMPVDGGGKLADVPCTK
jgi:OOP family OmpA-OmpF porin